MKPHRIYAVVLRFMFLFRRSYDRKSDIFYWPLIDLLLWGITSAYFQSLQADENILTAIIGGLILWFVVWRAQYEIGVNLLEDIWNKNLVNLFVSPLKFWEWISAFFILGLIKIALSISFAAFVAFLLYRFNLLIFGPFLVLALPLLIMSGWVIGITVSAIILRYGSKVQTLAWSLAYVFSPLSAVFYPLDILPEIGQKLALIIPTSYVFESARSLIYNGRISYEDLMISFILNTIYLSLSLIFLKKSFHKILERGLVKVY